MAVVIHPLNQMLAEPASTAYAAARRAVTEAGSCEQAVELLGVLHAQGAEVRQEASAVFAAMPADIDSGILGALRDGFAHELAMELKWEEDTSGADPTIGYGVSEVGGRHRITFFAPNGARFVGPA